MSNSGNFQMQGRQVADAESSGPSINPGKGPTNRADILVAVGAIAVVVAVIGALIAG